MIGGGCWLREDGGWGREGASERGRGGEGSRAQTAPARHLDFISSRWENPKRKFFLLRARRRQRCAARNHPSAAAAAAADDEEEPGPPDGEQMAAADFNTITSITPFTDISAA